jgi:hypothetical protein
LPTAWQQAKADGMLWRGVTDSVGTGAPTPDGTAVLHQAVSSLSSKAPTRIALVGAEQRTVEDIGTLPHPSGAQLTSSAVTSAFVAFVYVLTNVGDAQSRWELYLFDRARRSLNLVARYRTDPRGQPLHGGWVHPVLTSRYLYWIQAAPDTTGWGGSEIEQYNLATGRIRTLYRGLTTAFVPYGAKLLYSELRPDAPPGGPSIEGESPPMRMAAVDQRSGRSVPAPAGLSLAADDPVNVVTNGDMIVWGTLHANMRAWTPAWGRSITIIPSDWPAGRRVGVTASPGQPRLYGHFLVWEPGTVWVLDLKTNTIAPLTRTFAVENLSGSMLSVEAYTAATARGLVNDEQWDQFIIDLAHMPDLPACNGR